MQRASFTNYYETHTSIFSHVSLKLQLKCCRTTSQLQWQLQHLILCLFFFFYFLCSRIAFIFSLEPRRHYCQLSTNCQSVCPSVLLSCLLSGCLAIFQLLTASTGLMSAVNDNNNNNNNKNNNRVSKNNNSGLLGTVCSCCAGTCNLSCY